MSTEDKSLTEVSILAQTAEYDPENDEVIASARAGTLPLGFDLWDMASEDGRSVAHIAAQNGTLPAGFNSWNIADDEGWTVAHAAARAGKLPLNFDTWDLRTKRGVTVAHVLAETGKIPKGFMHWELADNLGRTVAQVFASRSRVDNDRGLQNQTRMSENASASVQPTSGQIAHRKMENQQDENTVAELFALAEAGNLPRKFMDWNISDPSGRTVAHVAAERSLKRHPRFNHWELADNSGYSVAHAAARHGNLPKDFDRWEIADVTGWTVAHEVAVNGSLPYSFELWDLKTNAGVTVESLAAPGSRKLYKRKAKHLSGTPDAGAGRGKWVDDYMDEDDYHDYDNDWYD
jgi:hypothetical protein